MLKEIVIAIQAYRKAHIFIGKHRLWKWILIPGFAYMILFSVGLYFFWISADTAVSQLFSGLDKWLHKQHSPAYSFAAIMVGIMARLIMMLFYFSLFKYLFLILGSPVFSYLSEKSESIIEGKEFVFTREVFFKDIRRGIKLALRNCFWQTIYTIFILMLSFIPLVGSIAPVIAGLVECYFYGFSMLDYSCERHDLSPSESIIFISRRRGLAIGNGLVFYLMHFIPFVGWVLAPSYALVAATISLYHQNIET
ncbi:MAG: EI24 domain-containing protein [Bacteroidota bacterium]|nr:EI24 domain-containing protein [Bacteroidota bacterium]